MRNVGGSTPFKSIDENLRDIWVRGGLSLVSLKEEKKNVIKHPYKNTMKENNKYNNKMDFTINDI